MASKGISAPRGLQCSQDSISRSASCRLTVLISTTLCCARVGSKKSRGILPSFLGLGPSLSCLMHCLLSDRLQVAMIVQSPTLAVQVTISSGLITGEESGTFFCFCFRRLAGVFFRGIRLLDQSEPLSSKLVEAPKNTPQTV